MAQQFAHLDYGDPYFDFLKYETFDNRRLSTEQFILRPFSTVLRAAVELTTQPITTIMNIAGEKDRVEMAHTRYTKKLTRARDVAMWAGTTGYAGYTYVKDTFTSREQPDPGPEEAENRNRTMEDNPVNVTKADLNAHPDSKKAQQVAGNVRDRPLVVY